MITISKLSKWVNNGNNRIFLLKDIHVSIAEGEFVSIMGPSGSGKSTLLNVIGMLDQFDEGEYVFMDTPVHQLRRSKRPNCTKPILDLCFKPII